METNGTLHNKGGKVRMSQSTCELRPEAEPKVTNMYFEAFFFTSRVV